ncbi:MAG: phosphoribosylformylglycinamidine synthase subunit PurQ, partial [Devosiaceae bacterium]|nr:phosphoribosylformylglycinamidine synthase subunit PurQ [Devosiaceae bacterium]
MKSLVIQFPGSNRDRDMIAALELISGHKPQVIWHQETTLPPADLIVVPGGF